MNTPDKENLKELLGRFMDAAEVDEAARDIDQGDELLRTFPAPQPDEEVIADVKAMMSAVVRRRHRITLHRRIFAAAAAAAIVIASATALKYLDRQPGGQTTKQIAFMIPDRIWESTDITTDDADIAVLTAEITSVENELYGVELSDDTITGSTSADELEMELIGIGSNFWKG